MLARGTPPETGQSTICTPLAASDAAISRVRPGWPEVMSITSAPGASGIALDTRTVPEPPEMRCARTAMSDADTGGAGSAGGSTAIVAVSAPEGVVAGAAGQLVPPDPAAQRIGVRRPGLRLDRVEHGPDRVVAVFLTLPDQADGAFVVHHQAVDRDPVAHHAHLRLPEWSCSFHVD